MSVFLAVSEGFDSDDKYFKLCGSLGTIQRATARAYGNDESPGRNPRELRQTWHHRQRYPQLQQRTPSVEPGPQRGGEDAQHCEQYVN